MTDATLAWLLASAIVGIGLLWKLAARRQQRAALAAARAGPANIGRESLSMAQEAVKEKTPMSDARVVVEQITRFLEARKTVYRLSADGTAIEVGFVYPAARFMVTITVREDGPFVCVVTQIPMVIPEARRPAVAELIVRINYGLMLGAFALDLSDGELHFRVTMPLADAELTENQFGHLMGASLWSADRYHKAFCRLLYGDDLSPAEAVAEVEMAG